MQLPADFKNAIQRQYPHTADAFLAAIENAPVTSVRVNPAKPTTQFNANEQVPWCNEGFYLHERPSFIADPTFHAGAYYVQESSGMFLSHVLKQLPCIDKPIVALDLCAAPGGKSTLVQSAIATGSVLIANEVIKARVNVLVENMVRWGTPGYMVTSNDPAKFGSMQPFVDVMVVDAPCSGEGLFRRDALAANEWSSENVMLCAARQQRILGEVLPALKPGGFLVYSTCTFNTTENEENVHWLRNQMGLESFRIHTPAAWPVDNEDGCMFRFLPHRVKGEGLFMAVLRKPGGEIPHENKFREPKLNFVPRKLHAALQPWLTGYHNFDFVIENDFIYALPLSMLPLFGKARQHLYLKHAGICMGKFDKGGDLIPEHSLALSTALSPSVSSVEVNRETALLYLRKENITLPATLQPGWHVLRYQGLALGWIKVLPNRINNYLPAQYRILKAL